MINTYIMWINHYSPTAYLISVSWSVLLLDERRCFCSPWHLITCHGIYLSWLNCNRSMELCRKSHFSRFYLLMQYMNWETGRERRAPKLHLKVLPSKKRHSPPAFFMKHEAFKVSLGGSKVEKIEFARVWGEGAEVGGKAKAWMEEA